MTCSSNIYKSYYILVYTVICPSLSLSSGYTTSTQKIFHINYIFFHEHTAVTFTRLSRSALHTDRCKPSSRI